MKKVKCNTNRDIYNYNTESKINQKNKKIKWIVLAIILISIIAVTIGIVMFIKSPKYAVMQEIKALKNGDLENANKYVNYKSLISCLDDSIEVGTKMSELENNCFNLLSYTINSEEITGETAKVDVTVTNKNFRNALNNWIKFIYQKQINGEQISDEESKNELNNYLKDSRIGTVTSTKKINLKKSSNIWKIDIDDNFEDLIFPGLKDLVNSIDVLVNQ